MPTTSTPPAWKRRTFLQGAAMMGLVAAQPALAQGLRRATRLPRWVQWTRISGPAWGSRGGLSIRAYPGAGYATVFSWSAYPARASTIHNVPDPGGLLAEKMFRLYEIRGAEELSGSPTVIEDFCWIDRAKLHESVWTSTMPAAAELWDAFRAAPNAEVVPIPPSTRTVLLVQPTMDSPQDDATNTIDLRGDLSSHPLSNMLQAMIASDLMVATSPQDTSILLDGMGDFKRSNSILVMLPPGLNVPYGAIYLRTLPFIA